MRTQLCILSWRRTKTLSAARLVSNRTTCIRDWDHKVADQAQRHFQATSMLDSANRQYRTFLH